MDQFEYVTTMASFVVAFGVSRLIAGWAQQFIHRRETPAYPLQVAVSVLMLIALLQNTWAMWFTRDVIWTFGTFLLMVFSQLALVGAAALIHPPLNHTTSIREHYFEVRHAVFGLCAVWIIIGATIDSVLAVTVPGISMHWGMMLTIRGVAFLTFLFMAWSDRPSLHWACFAVSALLQLGWILEVTNSPGA
jgi:hypothetical protein